MANTAYGPYNPTTWVNGVTAANQTNLNNLESQSKIALHGFNGDLFTPFVLSGVGCTKDGSVVNQLDVASGRAYVAMSDGTLGLIVVGSTTFTTSTPSTTYYLDLNPDGTWSWGTAHSGVTNHLTICSVTTDGSGNISAVTDARTLNTTILSGMAGSISFPGGALTGTSLTGTAGTLPISSQQSGAANGVSFKSWNGTAGVVPFSVGGQFSGAKAWIDNSGNLQLGGAAALYPAVVFDAVAQQGETAGGITIYATSGGTNPDFIIQNNGNGYIVISSGAKHVSFRAASNGASWCDLSADTSWTYLSSANLGTRFQTAGNTVAHFGKSTDTYQLIVNGGFQYGSGGADDAELVWAEDLSLGAADVVCWDVADDGAGHGGRVARCTHTDCPAAGVISTRPASVKGGALLPGAHGDPTYDTDPHWKPLAMEGRVPVKVVGDVASYTPGMPLVAAGDGAMRPWRRGDKWVRAVVASIKSDVEGRTLAAGCVLAQVR